jgi:hypothetical protein
MTTNSYWIVREQVGIGLYHLVDAIDASTAWNSQPRAQALCGRWIIRADSGYDTRDEADMIGEPTCHACFRRAHEPNQATPKSG